MSKGISSYPTNQKAMVIARRLKGKEKGLGYWAVKDFTSKGSTPKVKSAR